MTGGSYDVLVVGQGAMGRAAEFQAAARGAKVLGIEAFTPAHELGSSSGLTRIIRLAYFEHRTSTSCSGLTRVTSSS